MDLAHPHLAWLILVPLLLGLLAWRAEWRRTSLLARFALREFLPGLIEGEGALLRTAHWALAIGGTALLAAALVGPRWGSRSEAIMRTGLDIVIALDTSRSMLADDAAPSRLEAAKKGIEGLAGAVGGDRIGLVAFAGSAFLVCPLTTDRTTFRQALREITPETIPRRGTSLERAIDEASTAFRGERRGARVVIVVSDGESHEGDPIAAARRARERGIVIFTACCGTPAGGLIPEGGGGFHKDRGGNAVKSRADGKLLAGIAAAGGGTFLFAGSTPPDLASLYREKLAHLDRGVASSRQTVPVERFQIPLAAVLLLLALEPLVVGRRKP